MKKFDSINIIPFVDIMLVLLAIVLTTSTLIEKRVIPISVPSSSSSIKLNSKDITITIKEDGTIFWESSKVDKVTLKLKIKELKKDDNININCDKSSKFENFVTLLDSLKEHGLTNISIVTKNNE